MNINYKKKKIAFVVTRFVAGGLERSFLDLLDCIDSNRYDTTVYLPDFSGEWSSLLQKRCNVKILPIYNYNSLIANYLKKFQFYSIIKCSIYRLLARIYQNKDYAKRTEYFIRSMPREKEKYDFVGAYQIINDECTFGSLYRFTAKKKAVWSHSDMNRTSSTYRKLYGKFDKIFCVSEYSKRVFSQAFPILTPKTEILYNTINPTNIINKSLEKNELAINENEIILVTVARLAEVKGQTMIPTTV